MENVNNLKTLTRQTKSVFCVINFPVRKDGLYDLSLVDFAKFSDDLSRCSFLYAMILHDRDVNDDGTIKTPHIHLHITCDKRHQIKYFVYLLADLLNFNESLISVRVSNSDAGDIQYLIHKNNPNKYQYLPEMILTNFSKEVFDDLLTRKIITSFTTKELVNICLENDRLHVMEILGPERYNHYSKVINDIYKEIRIARRYSGNTNYKVNI